ncbi:hypothetical protein PYCC9005_001743 [Savitreella phatthalungensis]
MRRLYMCITGVQTLAVVVLESYVLGRYLTATFDELRHGTIAKQVKGIPTYFALVLFAEFFGIIVAWDSVSQENTIQLIGLAIYHLALLVYAVIQIDQIKDALAVAGAISLYGSLQPFLVAIPCVIAVFTTCLAYLTWRLYREFGWSIYKHIGADLRMRRRFMAYQILVSLLKFDFIFFLGFSIQFAVIALDVKDPEFALTLAAIPTTVLGLIFTAWALRHEKRWGMAVSCLFMLAGLSYFLFKLIRLYAGPKAPTYGNSARRPLATFAIVTIALLVATLANGIVCVTNFGHGLKHHVLGRSAWHEAFRLGSIRHRGVTAEPEHGNNLGLDHSPYPGRSPANRFAVSEDDIVKRDGLASAGAQFAQTPSKIPVVKLRPRSASRDVGTTDDDDDEDDDDDIDRWRESQVQAMDIADFYAFGNDSHSCR